jgi:hypothetical protein
LQIDDLRLQIESQSFCNQKSKIINLLSFGSPLPRVVGTLPFTSEGPSFMIEMLVDLDFACCSCGASLGVTLKCEGIGPNDSAHEVAAVKVACPCCSDVIELCFELSGMIRAVRPCQALCGMPEPSLN